MSRVLKNIKSFVVTFPNTCTVTVTTIRSYTPSDTTQFDEIGSDNESSPRYYIRWLSFQGSLGCSDPVGGNQTKLQGTSNCNVAFQAVDVDNNQNVNCTATGCAFGQIGFSEQWGNVFDVQLPFRGGSLTMVAA